MFLHQAAKLNPRTGDAQALARGDGLYRREVTLEAKVDRSSDISLQLQACNDRDGRCLAPETLLFTEAGAQDVV